MRLRPGEEVGEETHHLYQFIRFEAGVARVELDGIVHETGADDKVKATTRSARAISRFATGNRFERRGILSKILFTHPPPATNTTRRLRRGRATEVPISPSQQEREATSSDTLFETPCECRDLLSEECRGGAE